ncbi:MAG: bifunctional 4-hydroxy-2-oxoglutarate aldolase/2-dehydro-3-deoxy-phosphogluconate aldolase [Beijerinckiaceae bacterium]|nr:bifunctional 4-hydroxy-2-oxoglutarate aldolase/2-dehydro-3-deoxy-phosphogluconate aldolase [Beijerinckiaceae bacterium]
MSGSDPNQANKMPSLTRAMLRGARLIPVLTIVDADTAVPLAKALVAGGVRTLEVTLRTAAGADAATAIREQVPDAIVGLGTVLTAADLDLCRERGFHFAFSPGASPALLDAAAKAGIAFVPGIQTASEIMACLEHGFDSMKFFPAVPAGGIAALKALAGPFPNVSFCPTGGISEADTAAWLKLPNVLAVGGSWLAPPDEVARGDWAAITARASRALAALS